MQAIKAARKHFLKLIIIGAWVLLVLYPNPVNLFASLYRLKNPPVMPLQVTGMALELENIAPHEIEQFVYKRIPYQFDWEVYNMPWYFPTLEEALQNGSGDCKARFLLFASLMEEMGLPYQKNISLTHIWVGYENKAESNLENLNEALVVVDQDGIARFSLPRPDLQRSSRSFYRGFWEVMPEGRKTLLLSGFPLLLGMFSLHSLQHGTNPAAPVFKLRRK